MPLFRLTKAAQLLQDNACIQVHEPFLLHLRVYHRKQWGILPEKSTPPHQNAD